MKFAIGFVAQILFTLSLSLQTFSQEAVSVAPIAETPSIISSISSLDESVKSVPCKNAERFEAVKKLFIEMGAKPEEVITETFDKGKLSNVVVTKKGMTDEIIVIGAHYDKTSEGCGAIDNWTGIAIIAHLYKTLSKIETQKTFVFVAFDQEEKGLYGSDAMVRSIPKEKRTQYCSMINFDSFGFTAPYVMRNASSPKLIKLAEEVGKANDFKLATVEIPGADTDSSSFIRRDIPAIDFSGVDGNWKKYLHTSNDMVKNIKIESVNMGYRFGLVFAAKLDENECREVKKK